MKIAAVVRATGSMPPRWLLYGVDVYSLNLYLIAVSRYPPSPQSGAGRSGPRRSADPPIPLDLKDLASVTPR
jgi:hypothetical protein